MVRERCHLDLGGFTFLYLRLVSVKIQSVKWFGWRKVKFFCGDTFIMLYVPAKVLRKGSCQSKPWRAYGARICMQCETLCLCIIIHLKEYPLCKLVLCASGFCLVSMPCKRWWCVASVVHRMSGGGVRVLPRLVLVSSMLTCLVRLRLCLFPIIIGLSVEISDNFTKHLAYLC